MTVDNRAAMLARRAGIRFLMRLACIIGVCASFARAAGPIAEPGDALLPVVQPASPLNREAMPAPLELAAVGPAGLSNRMLMLRGGVENPLTFVWVLRQSRLDPVLVWFEIANEWCSTTQLAVLDVLSWSYGGEYKVHASLAPPAISVCGRGALTVRVQRAGDDAPIEVGRVPCWIEPRFSASNVDADTARRRFGSDATVLGKSCRLFPGTSLDLDIPDGGEEAIGGVGIISALRFSAAFTQDEPVLEIAAENGQFAPVHVLAGVHTSVGEYDAPRPGVLKLDKAEVFSSVPYPGVSWKETAVPLLQYIAILPFERPQPVSRLRLNYIGRAGAIDVFEVALLHSAQARGR